MSNPTGKGGFQDHPELINKEGAPKRGQNWQESVKRLTDMTRDELVEYVGGKKTRIGKLLASASADIPMKDAVIVAALVAFLVDPNPRMFTALSDREDGKPNQPITGKDGDAIKIVVEYADNTNGNQTDVT
jgi:hypothetical protein